MIRLVLVSMIIHDSKPEGSATLSRLFSILGKVSSVSRSGQPLHGVIPMSVSVMRELFNVSSHMILVNGNNASRGVWIWSGLSAKITLQIFIDEVLKRDKLVNHIEVYFFTKIGFPFSTIYVASSIAFVFPIFFAEWATPAGMKSVSPSLSVTCPFPATS
jgi:hypothetical protein